MFGSEHESQERKTILTRILIDKVSEHLVTGTGLSIAVMDGTTPLFAFCPSSFQLIPPANT